MQLKDQKQSPPPFINPSTSPETAIALSDRKTSRSTDFLLDGHSPVKDLFDGSEPEKMALILEEYKNEGPNDEKGHKFLMQLLAVDNDLDRLYILNKQAEFSPKALTSLLDSLGFGLLGFFGTALSAKKQQYKKNKNYLRLVNTIEIVQKSTDLLKKPYSSLRNQSSVDADTVKPQQFIFGLLRSYKNDKQYETLIKTINLDDQQLVLLDLIRHRKELYQRLNPKTYDILYNILRKYCIPHMLEEDVCTYYTRQCFSHLDDTQQELFCFGLLMLPPLDQLEILHRQYLLSPVTGAGNLNAIQTKLETLHLREFDVTGTKQKIISLQASHNSLLTKNLTQSTEGIEQLLFTLLYEKNETRRLELLLAQQLQNPAGLERLKTYLATKHHHLLEIFRHYQSKLDRNDLESLNKQLVSVASLPNLHKISFIEITNPKQRQLFLLGLILLAPAAQDQVLAKQGLYLRGIFAVLLSQRGQYQGFVGERFELTIAKLALKNAEPAHGFLNRLFSTPPEKKSSAKKSPTIDPELLQFIAAYLIHYYRVWGKNYFSPMKRMINNFFAGKELTMEKIRQHTGERTKQVLQQLATSKIPGDHFVLEFAARYLFNYVQAGFFNRNPLENTMRKRIEDYILKGSCLERAFIEAHPGGRSRGIIKQMVATAEERLEAQKNSELQPLGNIR